MNLVYLELPLDAYALICEVRLVRCVSELGCQGVDAHTSLQGRRIVHTVGSSMNEPEHYKGFLKLLSEISSFPLLFHFNSYPYGNINHHNTHRVLANTN